MNVFTFKEAGKLPPPKVRPKGKPKDKPKRKAPKLKPEKPWEVAFLADSSSSMRRSGGEKILGGIGHFLMKNAKETRFTYVPSEWNGGSGPPAPMINRVRMKNVKVLRYEANGDHDHLCSAIGKGAELLMRAPKGATLLVFLLTDGGLSCGDGRDSCTEKYYYMSNAAAKKAFLRLKDRCDVKLVIAPVNSADKNWPKTGAGKWLQDLYPLVFATNPRSAEKKFYRLMKSLT